VTPGRSSRSIEASSRQRDDHHRLATGPGDDHFLAVIDNGVQGLGVMRARLGVRHDLHRPTTPRVVIVVYI